MQHPKFKEAAAQLSARLQGKEKADVISEDVRQYRRTRMLVGSFVVALLLLTITAAIAYWNANTEKIRANLNEQRVRQNLYVANIQLAQKAFEEGYVGRGHELLRAIEHNTGTAKEDDVRGFFWYYLWRNYPNELTTLRGHTNYVPSVTFSSDGKMLATGSYDETVKLWDVASRQELATLTGHMDTVHSVAFSSDGKTLATGSGDQTGEAVGCGESAGTSHTQRAQIGCLLCSF